MPMGRKRWRWQKAAKVEIELDRELALASVPSTLRGELGSALKGLCSTAGRSPFEIDRSGPVRLLRVVVGDQNLYVFFALSIDQGTYIGLHVAYICGPDLPTRESYNLAQTRFAHCEDGTEQNPNS